MESTERRYRTAEGPTDWTGRRELVLVAAEDLDALEETLDILSGGRLRNEMAQANGDVDVGLGVGRDALPPALLSR
ncbi:hypothetical protein J1G44_09215 [Cellulomonas sp. zg-ZUI199]|uniref:Uncharacterized protein n=1 Tax=Cellulomonas wangleii TaxID=2816956 RepID=A0ABX8D6T6_9CELL|nr:hypothetical protein [Cellulomonas wangleii]MBO0924662.1 hypothetical protein [Cellulomonas wangleii]QVI62851.1 hypothetical protein KG103_02620 [Cellulomonas wangleii]